MNLKRLFKRGLLVLISTIFVFNMVSCSGKKETADPVILRCNDMNIKKSTYLLCFIDEAGKMYGKEDIAEEDFFDIAKENALLELKRYTFFKKSYDGIYTISPEEFGKLQKDELEELLFAGMEYDPKREDEVFMEYFGVTFDQYMEYRKERYMEQMYIGKEFIKQINDKERYDYFLNNTDKYGIGEVDAILLPNGSEESDISKKIKEDLLAGYSLNDIKSKYKDYILKGDNLKYIDSTAVINDAFGEGFKEKVLISSEGDIEIIENNRGIVIFRTVKIEGFEENENKILNVLLDIKISEIINDESIDIEIVDRELFDSIKDIPKGPKG